jgi:hypothetical protein
MSRFLSIASLAALLAGSGALSAQEDQLPAAAATRSQTNGFMVGASLNASSLSGLGQSGADAGGGIGARIGYGFSRLQIFAGLDAGSMTGGNQGVDYGAGHVEAGARYSLGSDSRLLRPYVQAALMRLVAIEGEGADEVTTSGGGYSAGVGAEYFARRSLSVDLGLSHSRGSFSMAETSSGMQRGLDRGYATTRLTLGLNWRP